MLGIGAFARVAPDAAALVSMGGMTTYADLDERQHKIAGGLRALGLERGDRLAIYSSNRKEYIELAIGALRAGIVPVPIHHLLTEREAAYIIEDSGAALLFTDKSDFGHPQLSDTIVFGDAYERWLFEADPVKIADVALGRPMHYTSGTTGHPKGVWVNPLVEAGAAKISTDFIRLWGLSSNDVHLVCSPLSHSAPLRYPWRTLEAGGRVVLQTHFDPEETLAAVELLSVTSTFMVPTHLERLLALSRAKLRRYDLSSLTLVIHAGAPIREDTKRRAMELFPSDTVWEFYGATEGQVTRISPEEWERKPGSVGTPTRGVSVSIRSEDGKALPRGETGLVWVTDTTVPHFEYWRDRAKTERAWNGDSFTVRDLGWLDDDGYLYLTGRADDTIISGGVNVYPAEVEEVLATHPAVAEVVVFGRTDEEWGQVVCAEIVPAYGQPLDPESLREWARERLAGFKTPRVIEIVDELPRTPTGKIARPREVE